MINIPAYVDPVTLATFSLDIRIWKSPEGGPLMLTPLPGIRRNEIDKDRRSLWRYRSALPINIDNPITLSEGCTPLVQRSLRGARCSFSLLKIVDACP